MKKLVCLLVALCLTAALFSCTDTPETKQEEKTPSVTETPIEPTTPSEITTPDEITTPNEQEVTTQDTPETVTPTEPEVVEPDEVNIANYIKIIAETNKEKSESFFCLDDINFKNSYVTRKLVAADHFNFGDYSLFIRIPTFVYSLIDIPVYSYGFITSSTANSSKSLEKYKKFNEKYIVEKTLPDGNLNGAKPGKPVFFAYYDLLAKSKIVYISEEADVIGRLSLTDGGSWVNETYEKDKDLFGRTWNSIYEVLNPSGELICLYQQKNIDYQDLYCGGFFEMFDMRNYSSNRKFYFSIESANSENAKTQDKYTVYNVKNGTPTKETLLNLTLISDKICSIKDYDGTSKLLISVYDDIEDYTLIYDINTKETELLEYNAYNATLSPDGNYLAYTPPFYTEEGEIYDKEKGFYIKEICTGKTVFYDYSDVITKHNNEYFFLGWIKENKLE